MFKKREQEKVILNKILGHVNHEKMHATRTKVVATITLSVGGGGGV